jgi:diacylglycerol kinase (ATP)
MKCTVVVNPASGNGRTGKHWQGTERLLRQNIEPLLAALGGSINIVFTQAVEDATLLTHNALANEHCEHIIAVGGDGTFSEVVNGFFVNDRAVNPNAVVSFIPSGTGSDIARTLGTPTHKPDAIQRIADAVRLQKPARTIDVGKLILTDKHGAPFTMYFANVASCGMSGVVDKHINRARFLKKLGGKAAFYAASMSAMLSYTNQPVRVRVAGAKANVEAGSDDSVFETEITMRSVVVANGQYFGGGMWIAPNAALDDGVFDIIIIGDMSRTQAVMSFQTLYSGTHLANPCVQALRGTSVTIEPLNPSSRVLLDVDGEAPGVLPATFSVLPKALRVLM